MQPRKKRRRRKDRMKREDIEKLIKDAGIADDKVKGIVDIIMTENGKDIETEKAKTTAESEKVTKANDTIKNLQESIKKFDGVDVDGLKKSAKDWEDKYNKDISSMKLENALEMALVNGKAKNTKAVKALLNLDDIKLDGDKLLGLDTQIETLKKDNAFLFDEVKEDKPGIKISTGADIKDDDVDLDKFVASARKAAGLPETTENK